MSTNNWLKKLIFVEDETNEQEEHVKQPQQPEKTTNAHKETVTNSTSPMMSMSDIPDLSGVEHLDPSLISGKIDQVLLNKLVEVLDSQVVEGIDYLKFKKSVDSLKDIQPDETIRFTTVYLTLKATYPSMTKENLTLTIDGYIELMEKERKKGLDQLNNLRRQNIDKKEEEIKKAINNIEKMKSEIQKLSSFVTETNSEIIGKKNEYTVREADFNATVDRIVNQLSGDKIKLETIIKTN